MVINKLREDRIAKVQAFRQMGIDPYPYRFEVTYSSADIVNNFNELADITVVKAAGRLRLIRRMGKASFADLHDAAGKIQLYFRRDDVGVDAYKAFRLLDLGDIIGVEGVPFRTKTGEITIKVSSFEILCKSIRPLSDKWRGLRNRETRYRQRYLDLIMNPEVEKVFQIRTRMMSFFRNYLNNRDFIEVETPILQPLYGGALARPFITHHNTLDMDLYLRIADELYLKRLIIGGMERVYEVCKDFRNEGMDRLHNPEFTMIELYQSFADYFDMMELLENMLSAMAEELLKGTKLKYQGVEIDLTPPWRRESYYDLVKRYSGWNLMEMSDAELAAAAAEIAPEDNHSAKNRGRLIDFIFSEKVEPHLIGPLFVTDFPLEISPLSKAHRSEAGVTERFELYLFGREVANAFSELNDPLEQRRRFEQQVRWSESGDMETQPMDEDFLRALEFGMPPTGGMGIGFDRLVMFFTDQPSIRDVILFPQLRPEEMSRTDDIDEEEE
ncbi:MAG: lysine--tRNA ligase [candidate division Zixibacteria bacterium]|nr:lysine--tRNA ligase [Candidatus Tariuqbacter arcticus]